MSTQEKLIQIRTRKLGLLVRDARTAAGKTVEQCAAAMGVTPEQFQTYEAGEKSPSLPEVEGLSFFLNLPLEQFWGRSSLTGKAGVEPLPNIFQINKLRQRVIGTVLRMARARLNLSSAELAEKTSLPEAKLKQYEAGEIAVPLPELEVLAASLGMQIEEFFDERGPVGSWRKQQQAIQQFLELPADQQAFVCSPVNRPYIELAMRLSELNVDKLRAVAEGLLEITY